MSTEKNYIAISDSIKTKSNPELFRSQTLISLLAWVACGDPSSQSEPDILRFTAKVRSRYGRVRGT